MTTNRGTQGPIFIGGLERSGKTYMRMMLAAHPRLAFSRRTNMWTNFHGRFGNLDQPENVDRCLRAMMQQKLIRELDPDPDRIRREFAAGPRTYGRLFALIHQHHAERAGKPRWGDQTALVERCATAVFAAYPHAKMIQMIRDPRDRFEALCTRDPRERRKLGQATAKWLYSEAHARHNQQTFPDQIMVVRYESMVAEPEKTMRAVCHFLDEAYTPTMLAMAHEPRFHRESGISFALGVSPLSTAYIGRFHEGLSRQEIAFMQVQAGTRMLAYGYAPEPIRLTPWEKIRFYLGTWRLHGAQMAIWRAWHATRIHSTVQVDHQTGLMARVTARVVG